MMLLKVRMTLGHDLFEVEGDFALEDPAFAAALQAWLDAKTTKDDTPGQLEQLADTLESATADLQAAVTANTIPVK